MCDETKTDCIGVTSTSTSPKNDSLICLTRTMNHLTAIRTTPLQKNEYTPMPSTKALSMDEPSTSSYPPQFVEYMKSLRKPRSNSDVTFHAKRKEDSKCEHQMSKNGPIVRTLPVVPPFLTSKSKVDLSRRVGGATQRVSQSPAGNRDGRKRSLSVGSLSLEKPRKHDHKQFRNALHRSFGDADISRLTVQDNDPAPALRIGVCPECHRCRCIQCARPRNLPSQWICGDTCLLSSGCIVDSLSCMCCVKAVRYHCRCFETCFALDEHPSKIDEKAAWRRRKVADLMCVLLASICLPCLCCYLPLKGCEAAVEGIYCAWNDRSCHCDYRRNQSPAAIIEQPKTIGRPLQKQRITC